MPLRIVCPQGHTLIVSQARAGSTLRCPKCDARIVVPPPAPKRNASLIDVAMSALADEPERPIAAAAVLDEPAPPPVVAAVGEVEPPPVWTPPPKSRALVERPLPTPPEASPPAPSPSEQKAEQPAEPAPPEPKCETRPAPTTPPPPTPPAPQPAPELSKTVAAADDQVAAPADVPLSQPASVLPEPVAQPVTDEPAAGVPLPLVPGAAQQLGAFILSGCLIAAALFGVAPAVWDVFQSFQTAEASMVARWALVVLALCVVQIAYGVYLAQLPDWTSGWVVTVFALGSAAVYAGMLGVTAFAGENSRLVHSLHLSEYVASGRAPIWCLCMTSIMATLAFFGGRTSLRWRQAEAF